ncbi:hypothetical protein SSP24_13440 [Streptomyces spinoverrucosus]|uniref:Uncharacterized protein n=1 Tax=Streptomyces spinoverrucosus TaxID=284043 RepID=A0A4Y3VDC7_9ACTN|nr:hypothetical protein [Streptomyces spinoverrucosus]GEC03689.1 hypothetical protein SSP24_13440 [Streptomyces spinoverrucosus]GHB50832.1 hypothetical protein GCM10010397_21230 [Streptomyces spinoverrucosus]
MTDDRKTTVPVWTLATADVRVPALTAGESMTAERLAELRGVLAVLADEPIATLEVHPLPDRIDRGRGIPLDAASPLAQHLSQFITQSTRSSLTAARATASGENLYRMVVPAKVAAQLGQGIVRPMASKAAAGGIRGPLVDTAGKIAGGATFVPVGGAAAGTAGGAGATAGAVAAGGTALTVAAPLVLMAVAVGVSAHADHKRQQAIENITELLEQLQQDKLDDEHSALNGCRAAIDKATAILLDQGKLGVSLGLDSAVHTIDTALSKADIRLARWQSALDRLPEGEAVELGTLTKSFPGVDDHGGTFRTHLELASLAIALMRRVVVLQAVEHAQSEPGNPFENFTRALKRDQQRLDELESGIAGVLVRLSALELARPNGKRLVFTTGEVDRLMSAAHRIHQLADGVTVNNRTTDVAIEIARDKDGSVVVFPALPV